MVGIEEDYSQIPHFWGWQSIVGHCGRRENEPKL
jgi:hypothetical protein